MSHNTYPISPDGNYLRVSDYGNAGAQHTFNLFKSPPRKRLLGKTTPVFLDNMPCGYVTVTNQIENDVIFVGGLGDDVPYIDKRFVGDSKGQPIYPGHSWPILVDNANKVSIVGTVNQDIFWSAHLDQIADVATSTDSPPQIDTTPPTVSSVSPTNGSTSIARNTDIFAIMSEAIDSASITSSDLTISPSVAVTRFLDSTDNTKIHIKPNANLASATTYTITLTAGGGVKDLSGNALVVQFQWSFTTASAAPPPDTTPPTITSKTPTANATGINIGTSIQVVFSESIASGTVNSTNFVLLDDVLATVPCTVSLGTDQLTVTMTPNVTLKNSTKYTLQVKTGVTDLAGNHLASESDSTFTTISPSYTLKYNVSTDNSKSQMYAGNDIFDGLLVNSTSSKIYNIAPKKVVANAYRVGNPTGNIECKIFNWNTGVIVATLGNPIDISTVGTTQQAITFVSDNNNVQLGDQFALGIYYNGGNSSNYLNLLRDGSGSYDGSNTERFYCHNHLDSTGSFTEDSSRDAAFAVYV